MDHQYFLALDNIRISSEILDDEQGAKKILVQSRSELYSLKKRKKKKEKGWQVILVRKLS